MTLNWISPPTFGGSSVQQPVPTFDQEQSDHWEVLADMAYYQRLAMQEELDEDDIPISWLTIMAYYQMQEELDEDDIPIGWLTTKPSECQQINTSLQEDCT
jgi:hypothetical protein